MHTTQQGRTMAISTPLGEDYFLINKLSVTEAVSELFRFDVELLHEEEEEGTDPTVIDVKKILSQAVSIQILQKDGTTRRFNGMVNQFTQGSRDERFTYYYAAIVPSVWMLTQKHQSRIFQQKSIPDILKQVFTGFNVSYELQGAFEQRNYCVQYRETDFAFVSRLMEEEGIFYYFEHSTEGHKMIVANLPQSHKDCPAKARIPFALDVTSKEDFVSSIGSWQIDYKMQSGKVTLWDSHFELPGKRLEAEKPARLDISADASLEFYDYPGGYARKFDGINKGGGEQPDNLQKIFRENAKIAGIRMEEIDAQYKIAGGISDCCSMTAGHNFELFNHPNKDFNCQYVLISVTHEVEQSPDYFSENQSPNPYRNSFRCIPKTVPFRPVQNTPKPVIQGSQTALVVGPPGEEIFTDKYGRVKVQFRWDREGKNNADSSCWIRVVQSWAGKRWGMMFIPRVGMEVKVDFFEGDPDQPVITGCVYNAEMMPPYNLPDEKTKMAIKSDSSTGGQGFNEIRFEDKKDSEQIFIHGQKNLDLRVKNDRQEWIGNDRNLIVVKDKLEKIGGDNHLYILGDKNEKADGTVSLDVAHDLQEKVGQKYALDAGREVHIKSGMNLVIETGTDLTLKVGGNFININQSGIYIKGTMVMINSGGVAGSGAGSNPEMPKNAKEADKAVPGAAALFSATAMMLKGAAHSGAPFCDI